ncbi:MAG: LPXTG cell wall anchor domain-containing protein [Candidatus Saccharimonas sp.]
MTRRNEQGNAVVFVVVGVLLIAALVGAVLTVRHFQKTDGAVVGTTTTDKKTEDRKAEDSTASSGGQSSSDQALKDALAAQSQAEKDKQTQQSGSTANGGAQPTPSTATGASHLPETGPESTLIGLLGITLLAGTSFAYARSRRLI